MTARINKVRIATGLVNFEKASGMEVTRREKINKGNQKTKK